MICFMYIEHDEYEECIEFAILELINKFSDCQYNAKYLYNQSVFGVHENYLLLLEEYEEITK